MKLEIIGTKFAILYGGTGNKKKRIPMVFPQTGWMGPQWQFMYWWDIIPTFLSSSFPRWPGCLGTGFTHTYGILEYIIIGWIMLDWTGSGVTVYLLANMGVVYYILKAWISFFLEQPYTINHNKN